MPVTKTWTFQRNFLRKTYNKEVNLWFADIEPDLDNTTGRKAAKAACIIRPKDTMTTVNIKMQTFYNVIHLL